jgi:hypothetical protein
MKGLVKFGIVTTVLVGGGLGIYLGYINPDWLRGQARMAGARTAGAAANLVNSATSGAPRLGSTECAAACRENLRRIEGATRAIHRRGQFATGTFTWSAVERELGSRPVCPCGGTYSLGDTETLPTCSIAGGGTVDTADDHVVKRF